MLNQIKENEQEFLVMEEVQRRYQLKRRTIYHMVATKTIPYTKFGSLLRFPANLLEKWERARTNVPALLKGIAVCMAFLLICAPAQAGQKVAISEHSAVLAIIGEAEGEPYKGKVAVAEVIRTRGSLKGVYGIKAPRVVQKKYSQKTYNECLKAWRESATSNITKGSTHWEGTKFKTPYWAKNMIVMVTIGNQRFYKERG